MNELYTDAIWEILNNKGVKRKNKIRKDTK